MMEWTECKNCIYFDECENKEDRDGCYCGEREESLKETDAHPIKCNKNDFLKQKGKEEI